MAPSRSLALCAAYLGRSVEVIIDRPRGSLHPEHGFRYEANYGHLAGTRAPDGEELDAYFLGVDRPVDRACGLVVAIVHRLEDDDDKLVVVPEDQAQIDDEAIERQVGFQERWFAHVIVRSADLDQP